MAISRYSRSIVLNGGKQLGTGRTQEVIRNAIKFSTLGYREIFIRGHERLDTIAGEVYGDAQYWWILAAASNIGWGLQVPPGTVIRIPDLRQALEIVG